jgi:hypothetical protein
MGEVRNIKLYIRKKVGNKERKREAKKVFLHVLTLERKSNEKYRQGNLSFLFPNMPIAEISQVSKFHPLSTISVVPFANVKF